MEPALNNGKRWLPTNNPRVSRLAGLFVLALVLSILVDVAFVRLSGPGLSPALFFGVFFGGQAVAISILCYAYWVQRGLYSSWKFE